MTTKEKLDAVKAQLTELELHRDELEKQYMAELKIASHNQIDARRSDDQQPTRYQQIIAENRQRIAHAVYS